jgi:hypothetical protein
VILLDEFVVLGNEARVSRLLSFGLGGIAFALLLSSAICGGKRENNE